MLRNCKVVRVLPRIADYAKNDRNAVLRARYLHVAALLWWSYLFALSYFDLSPHCRCCEYALLILEHWPDAPEIQRSADLYEDLIRCCVSDAMSEVFMLGVTSFLWHLLWSCIVAIHVKNWVNHHDRLLFVKSFSSWLMLHLTSYNEFLYLY